LERQPVNDGRHAGYPPDTTCRGAGRCKSQIFCGCRRSCDLKWLQTVPGDVNFVARGEEQCKPKMSTDKSSHDFLEGIRAVIAKDMTAKPKRSDKPVADPALLRALESQAKHGSSLSAVWRALSNSDN
jgi:hypothetical protein